MMVLVLILCVIALCLYICYFDSIIFIILIEFGVIFLKGVVFVETKFTFYMNVILSIKFTFLYEIKLILNLKFIF